MYLTLIALTILHFSIDPIARILFPAEREGKKGEKSSPLLLARPKGLRHADP